MKLVLLTTLILCTATAVFSQANTKLSNLVAPTTVNASLIPNTTNSKDLGTSTLAWRNTYLRGDLYLDGTRFVSNAPGTTSFNAFVGSYSGKSVTKGTYNTAFGHNALYKDTTGSYNTAVGANALYNNIYGDYNLAIGPFALYNNTSGNGSIAIGYNALYTATSAFGNIAIGYNALWKNTTGRTNTAIGFSSLSSNIDAESNTAIGFYTLSSNTYGAHNTAVGDGALQYNTVGNSNTALGYNVLRSNTQGYENTATGNQALGANIYGARNTAYGNDALRQNKESYNTAFGHSTLASTINAQNNTAIGFNAGGGYDNGYNNVFVGAFTRTNGPGYYNVIAIGQSTISTAPNQVTIGNSATTSYRVYAGWSYISDGRYKKNLKENVPGLAFITKLRPVTYTLDATGLDAFLNKEEDKGNHMSTEAKAVMNKALKEKEAKIQTGFVAQEVEVVAKNLNYDFSGLYKPANDKDVYGLSYADFVVPLVKAVQELSEKNEELKKKNEEYELRLQKLEAVLTNANNNTSLSRSFAYLETPVPNPSKGITLISYHVPADSRATLSFTDMKGRVIKNVALSQGSEQVTIDSNLFAAGSYNYTLYVNGKQADSKQMLIAR